MRILRAMGVCGLGILLASLPCGARMLSRSSEKDRTANAALAGLSDAERAQLKVFSDRVKQYISMEHNLPADRLSPKAKIEQLEKQRQALRAALQQARSGAKQGDIFTAEVADVFRKLLRSTLAGPHGAKIRASLNHAEPIGPQDLKVNEVYPNLSGQPMQSIPPSMLRSLPVLPKGLEYKITGHTLSLRDADANMVVDYLPNALP